VACGCWHTMALGTDGTLYAWGHGGYGELGTDNTSNHASPTRISCPVPVQSVSCGDDFSMVIGTDGSVWTTGKNRDGRLGLGDKNNRNKLHKIEGVSAELGGVWMEPWPGIGCTRALVDVGLKLSARWRQYAHTQGGVGKHRHGSSHPLQHVCTPERRPDSRRWKE